MSSGFTHRQFAGRKRGRQLFRGRGKNGGVNYGTRRAGCRRPSMAVIKFNRFLTDRMNMLCQWKLF
jgi:hypothetical protein